MHNVNSLLLRAMVQVLFLFASAAAQAAVLADGEAIPSTLGVPVHQHFLPIGASVVTTRDASTCVVSRRLPIENALYRSARGDRIDFGRIVRSPAASLQAISTADGVKSFRIRMEYSVATGTPIILTIGDTKEDVQSYLEKSTDSLLLTEDFAAQIELAFRDGVVPVLSSVSSDTRLTVTDDLPVLDLAALEACAQDLSPGPAPGAEVDNAVRLVFHADPRKAPLATASELRAHGLSEEPSDLHLATLDEVGGFFSQTDQILVSFREDGRLARAYVEGVFDGDFSINPNTARLSRAADTDVPSAPNEVRDQFAAAEIRVCSYGPEEGRYLIAPCFGDDLLAMFPDATGYIPEFALRDTSGPGRPGASTRRVANGGSPVARSQSPSVLGQAAPGLGFSFRDPVTPGKSLIPDIADPGTGTGETPDITPVPLPISLFLLVAALASLTSLGGRTGKVVRAARAQIA